MARILFNIGTSGSGYTASNPNGEIITNINESTAHTVNFYDPAQPSTPIPFSIAPAATGITIPNGWRIESNSAANLWASIDTAPTNTYSI